MIAPGWDTGYDAKTLPGPRAAIEERRYADVDAQIALVAHAIEDEAGYIGHLAAELETAEQLGTIFIDQFPFAVTTSHGFEKRPQLYFAKIHDRFVA